MDSDDQNPLTNVQPTQSEPSVPSVPIPVREQEPVIPVSTTPSPSQFQNQNVIPANQPTQPQQRFATNMPVQEDEIKSKPFNKLWLIFTILFVLVLFGLFYLLKTNNKNKSSTIEFQKEGINPSVTNKIENIYETTLAPPGTTDFDKKNYRQSKITITEAQSLQKKLENNFGNLVIPKNLNFIYEEEYKGVTVKWTNGQPISPETLSWLKGGIDMLPEYFYKEHPVETIISATFEELGSPGVNPGDMGAAAYASGLNMFLTSEFAKGTSGLHQVDEPTFITTLFHEWVHIVQHYEVLQTFAEEYLSIPSNLIVVSRLSPFVKDYARQAGWIFQNDEYANSTYAVLGEDAGSKKITEYGKTKYVEDMAESGSLFMLCKTGQLSENRITWWEKTTNTSRQQYCPSPI